MDDELLQRRLAQAIRESSDFMEKLDSLESAINRTSYESGVPIYGNPKTDKLLDGSELIFKLADVEGYRGPDLLTDSQVREFASAYPEGSEVRALVEQIPSHEERKRMSRLYRNSHVAEGLADLSDVPDELVADALKTGDYHGRLEDVKAADDAKFNRDVLPKIEQTAKNVKASKSKARADALRKGFKVIKGGLKALTPVAPYLGALGFAMDAKDAYALGESTMNPKTEQDRERQRLLADLMRRNEFY